MLGTLRLLVGQVHPDGSVAFGARIAFRADALDFDVCSVDERWNRAALPGLGVKRPAVIAALDRRIDDSSEGKRHGAMRATVGRAKTRSLRFTPNDEGRFEKRHGAHCAFASAATIAGYQKPNSIDKLAVPLLIAADAGLCGTGPGSGDGEKVSLTSLVYLAPSIVSLGFVL